MALAGALGLAASGLKVAGGLKSLFGGGSGGNMRTARENTSAGIMGQAQGARWAFENEGFNPLTMLGVSSAMGPGGEGNGVPPLASIAAITGGLQDLADQKQTEQDRKEESEKRSDELERLKAERMNAGGAGPVIAKTAAARVPGVAELSSVIEGSSVQRGMAKVRPVSREEGLGLWSDGAILVNLPDGSQQTMPKKTIARLDPKAGNGFNLMMEDFEALFGEETGQVVGLPRVPGAVQQNLGGTLGNLSLQDRQEILDEKNSGKVIPDEKPDLHTRRKTRKNSRKAK